MDTLGVCIERAIISGFCQRADDGSIKLQVKSHSSDRYKDIFEGPARLITNVPRSIVLGEVSIESGGDPRWDSSWETSYRNVRVNKVGSGFVAYATKRSSTGCQYSGGDYVVQLAGEEVPVLDYGSAYALWAEKTKTEAYKYLLSAAADKKVLHSLAFASGVAHSYAPHDQRRRAWVEVLCALGVHEDVSRIIGSVRTATCKAALRLGWQPSVSKPVFWKGLPAGVVEITL
ncbi:MAG: hypothetical protein WC025_01800 [Candidatus Magasanikbacteria bacterium]